MLLVPWLYLRISRRRDQKEVEEGSRRTPFLKGMKVSMCLHIIAFIQAHLADSDWSVGKRTITFYCQERYKIL